MFEVQASALLMFASYGMCFGLMNDKVWFTHSLRALPLRKVEAPWAPGEVSTLFERLFQCAYCTGFHTGWVTWLLGVGMAGLPYPHHFGNGASLLVWSFASAVFCYLVDTAARRLEG
jgi:hypothetical protein